MRLRIYDTFLSLLRAWWGIARMAEWDRWYGGTQRGMRRSGNGMSQGGVLACKTSCKDGFPLLPTISIQSSIPLHPTIPTLASCYLKGRGWDVVTPVKNL